MDLHIRLAPSSYRENLENRPFRIVSLASIQQTLAKRNKEQVRRALRKKIYSQNIQIPVLKHVFGLGKGHQVSQRKMWGVLIDIP